MKQLNAKLQPYEYIEGYMFRLAHYSGARAGALRNKAIQTRELQEKLCERLGITHDTLLGEHTLLPILWALADEGGGARTRQITTAIRLRSEHLKACPECIKRDTEQLQFFYFRTYHQPKGVFYCQRHKCRLRSYSARDYSSNEIVPQPLSETIDLAGLGESELLSRYGRMVFDALTTSTVQLRTAEAIDQLRSLTLKKYTLEKPFPVTFVSNEVENQANLILKDICSFPDTVLSSLKAKPSQRITRENALPIFLLNCILDFSSC